MMVVALVVLAGCVAIGVVADWCRTRADRIEWESDQADRRAALLRELRRHGGDRP